MVKNHFLKEGNMGIVSLTSVKLVIYTEFSFSEI